MGVGIMGKIFCRRNGNFIPVGVMGVGVMGVSVTGVNSRTNCSEISMFV